MSKLNLYAQCLMALLFLLGLTLRAQEVMRFENIDFEDGLGSSWIFDIAEDSAGFIWFGGHTGLSRFDGVSCIHYLKDVKNPLSLSENQVFRLLAADSKRLFCSTIGGGLSVLRLDEGRFINYNQSTERNFPSNYVSAAVKMAPDTFYFLMGRPNSLVKCIFDGDSISYSETPLEWTSDNIFWRENKARHILRDPLNPDILWIVGNFRVYRFDSKKEELTLKSEFDFMLNGAYQYDLIRAVVWLDEHHIFMSIHGRGLCSFDTRTGLLTDLFKNSEITEFIISSCKLKDGTIWMGGENGSIYRYTPEGSNLQEIIPENRNLHNDRIESIFESSEGSIYLATINMGVLRYEPSANKFNVFILPPGLESGRKNEFSNGILHTKKPWYFLINYDENFVSKFNLETKTFEKLKGYAENNFGWGNFAMWQDEKILVHNQKAIFEISSDGSEIVPLNLPLLASELKKDNQNIRLMATDKSGLLVAVCSNFIYLLQDSSESIVLNDRGENSMNTCARDIQINNESVYFLCLESVQRLDLKTGKFSELTLVGNDVLPAINDWRNFEIVNDTLYFSSGSAGVMKAVIDGNNLNLIDWLTAPNGIISNNVYATSADEPGKIWFSTGLGLVRYIPSENTSINFSYLQNLPSVYQDRPVSINDLGYFAINNSKVILSGKVENLIAADTTTRLIFNSILVNGKEYIKGICYPQQLGFALEYNQNALNFAWSQLHSSTASFYNLYYTLEGFDEQWWPAKTPYEANYTNIPPGKYTFKVKSESVSNKKILTEARVALFIAAPFWATWWFRTIIALLLISAIVAFFKYRINTIRKEQRLIVEYDRQLADLKMQFLRAQMNPHFMFNSLNSIKHFILTNEREKASEYLSNFAQLIRSILSFSNTRFISLADELSTLETYIGLERIRFSDGFEYEIKVSDDIDPTALLVQPLIFQPYVENAVWHGLMHKESDRRLDIEITMSKNMLNCSITDNGIGREKSASIKTKSNTRKSLGLQISELRMKSQDANTKVEIIDIKSDGGIPLGTRVLISLPLKYFETKTVSHEQN